MSSIKCPHCGLTNFASTTECKRCKQSLEAPAYPYWNDKGSPVEPRKPDWSKLQTVPAVDVATGDLEDYGDGTHPIGNMLFAAYLAITAVLMIAALGYLNSQPTLELWKLVSNPKTNLYLPSFNSLYNLASFGSVIFLITSVLLLLLLFAKAKPFLRCVVIYLIADFAYGVAQGLLILSVGTELREKHLPAANVAADQIEYIPYLCLISVLLTFVWFRYFTGSKRARSVFE